jgi:hypothetical protein
MLLAVNLLQHVPNTFQSDSAHKNVLSYAPFVVTHAHFFVVLFCFQCITSVSGFSRKHLYFHYFVNSLHFVTLAVVCFQHLWTLFAKHGGGVPAVARSSTQVLQRIGLA